MVFSDLWDLKSQITALHCSPRSFGQNKSIINSISYNSVQRLNTYNLKTENAFQNCILKILMLGLQLNNTSFSRKVHLEYFAGSFPFPSLQFVLVSISHHTAHQVSLSCWFFRASEWTGSGTQSGSHIQEAQSKGKTKIRADKAWPNRVFSPLQTTHCSATSDT